GSAPRRPPTFDPLLSGALGEGLWTMAREHSGLVYQPANLVGSSNSGVVPRRRGTRPNRIAWRRLDARSRHARYLVLIVALGLRDDGRRVLREILSNQCARYRARYYFLLGGPHDHCRPR